MRLGGGRLRSGLRAGGERGAGGEEAAGAGAQAGEAERAAAEPRGQRGRRPAPAAAAAAAARRASSRRGLQPVGSPEPPGHHRRRLGGPGARAGAGRRWRRQWERRQQPRFLGDLLSAQPRALPALQPGAAPRGVLRLLQAGRGLLRHGRQRAGAGGLGDASRCTPCAALTAPHAAGRGGAAGPGEPGSLADRGRLHLVLPSSTPCPGTLASEAPEGGEGVGCQSGAGGLARAPGRGGLAGAKLGAESRLNLRAETCFLPRAPATQKGMNWSLHLLAFWSLLIFGSQAPRSRSLKNPCNFVLLLLGLAPFPSLFSVVTGDGEGLASACDCFCSFFPHEGWMGLTCGPSSRGVPACLAMELFPLESAPALGCAALRPFPAFSLVAPHFRD